jgi:glycosyltransferase involved in cell wall biosynthesis
MKLLIITQYFPPEMGAPQARLFELAKRLQGFGHEISVLTAMPNYPTGRIFDGYRGKIRSSGEIDGIRVIRTMLYPSNSGRTLPRLVSYLSWGFSILLFGLYGLGKHDVVLIESPPLFVVPFAQIIAKLVGGKSAMMISDIWPDIIIRMGHASPDGLFTRMTLWLESFCYRHSNAIALTNPGAVGQIRSRFPSLGNVTVISNGVDTGFFRPELRSSDVRKKYNAGPDDFLVGYCGLHGLAQGLDVILNAAALLRGEPHIRIIMVGDGPTKENLVKMARDLGLTNIAFHDQVPKKEMPRILASLDASLVPLSGRFPGTMPSKVYEAFASGTPPIVAKGCEAEALVERYNTGRTYEPADPAGMAEAIRSLAGNCRELPKIRKRCLELSKRFDREVIARNTENVLVALAEGRTLPEVKW